MPTYNEVIVYVKLDHQNALIQAFSDSQCNQEITETTELPVNSNPDGNPNNLPLPAIGVVFVNPSDPNNVKCGRIEFQIAPSDTCPFANSTVQPDDSTSVLLNDQMGDTTGPAPAPNKAVIRDGIAPGSTFKFSIYGAWQCVSGPRNFTLDPIIRVQNAN
jgi:hypothetical protein